MRDIAFGRVVFVESTVGEYRATRDCCKTLRSQLPGVEPRAAYTNRVRDAVIDRLLDDGVSLRRLQQPLQRDFLLDLSDGSLYGCLGWKVRRTDMPGYRQWTTDNFSGTLCVDELHVGHRTLLPATDPLGDFPVAFALVSASDQDHVRPFLSNLKAHRFSPEVVVTDGSNLCPAVLADIRPGARHQLGALHVIKDISAHVFDAPRRRRRRPAQKRGRKRRRGRPSKNQQRDRKRQGKTKTGQAYFVGKHRHLVVTRPEHLDGRQRRLLSRVFRYLPAPWTVRDVVLKIYRLLDPDQSPHQARCRRAALVKEERYLADPDLAKALSMPSAERFNKMVPFLHSPKGKQVRTNNHAERTSRRLRYFEKVRYKWRRRRTIVRFVVLALDRWRNRRVIKEQTAANEDRKSKELLPKELDG